MQNVTKGLLKLNGLAFKLFTLWKKSTFFFLTPVFYTECGQYTKRSYFRWDFSKKISWELFYVLTEMSHAQHETVAICVRITLFNKLSFLNFLRTKGDSYSPLLMLLFMKGKKTRLLLKVIIWRENLTYLKPTVNHLSSITKLWSSQLRTQFKQLRIEARKKSGLQLGSPDFFDFFLLMKHFIYHVTVNHLS